MRGVVPIYTKGLDQAGAMGVLLSRLADGHLVKHQLQSHEPGERNIPNRVRLRREDDLGLCFERNPTLYLRIISLHRHSSLEVSISPPSIDCEVILVIISRGMKYSRNASAYSPHSERWSCTILACPVLDHCGHWFASCLHIPVMTVDANGTSRQGVCRVRAE
jgi:hypothetical protein